MPINTVISCYIGLLHPISASPQIARADSIAACEENRAGGIRTRDLLHPRQALYQAEPRPDITTVFQLPAFLLATRFPARRSARRRARHRQRRKRIGGKMDPAFTGILTCLDYALPKFRGKQIPHGRAAASPARFSWLSCSTPSGRLCTWWPAEDGG